MKVSALIPAYNEEKKIASTVRALSNIANINEILVIDDGSIDETVQLAKEAGATVIKLDHNMGKGTALNMGAKHVSGEIVCLIDADLGESAKEAIKLITPIMNGKYQISIGKFPKKRNKGGFGFAKKLASWGIKSYTGQVFLEPLSGQRAFTKEAFDSLLPFAQGFGVEVFLTINAVKKGFKIIEVDTNMAHNETGRSVMGFWHRGKQFLHIAKALLMVRGLKHD